MDREYEKIKRFEAQTYRFVEELKQIQEIAGGKIESSLPPALLEVAAENEKLRYRINILKQRAAELKKHNTLQGSLWKYLEKLFTDTIRQVYPCVGEFNSTITRATHDRFGDYQCNSAMNLCQVLKQNGIKIAPMECAERIIAKVDREPLIESLDIAKPGFINIRIRPSFLGQRIMTLLSEGLQAPPVKKQKIIVDFSSPNVAKEMHVGHLRSTIIGESICRLLEFFGHDVLRLNHVGDWGTQFGMLIAHLQERFPNYLQEPPSIQNLQEFYKESKVRFDNDEEFKKQAHSCVVQLQQYDPNIIKAWKLICDISRNEIQKIYDCLDIHIMERGESFYQEKMIELVKELESKNVLVEDEGGRKVLFVEGFSVPLIIVKSDGGFTYDTSDLAALKQRVEEEKAEWIIYVVDAGQSLHLETVFAAGRQLGFCPPHVKLDHAAFGVVLGEDKKKFKTRSGDTVKLAELLEEGMQKSSQKLKEKKRDEVLSLEELKAAQEAVAYGCIKYADLSHNRIHDYVFSFDRMLDDKGNSAVYLLYALMRIKSIIRNSGFQKKMLKCTYGSTLIVLEHPKEIKLGKMIGRFHDVLLTVVEDLSLHTLCEYLYELSVVFSEFYDNCFIIEKNEKGQITHIDVSRLLLAVSTSKVMKTSFKILGLKPVGRM